MTTKQKVDKIISSRRWTPGRRLEEEAGISALRRLRELRGEDGYEIKKRRGEDGFEYRLVRKGTRP